MPVESAQAATDEIEAPTGAGTLVSIATYNERENLPLLVDAVLTRLPEAHLLVVDDNSPDGTGDWCDAHAENEPRLHCLHRTGKLGLGTAIVAAMQYAAEHDYRFLLNMDADFSHDPRYLPDLLGGMDDAQGEPRVDVMIGSRYVAGGGVENWPLHRRLMSWAVNCYARLLLGLRPRDTSGAYRCYRVSLLRKMDWSQVRSWGYSFQEEILWHLKRLGARMEESPIIFADRRYGSSKKNSREARSALMTLFRLGLKNWFGV